jgi:chaperone BCS1
MEDIDAVYGPNRTLKVPGRGPSFDCLLNCLSGAESSSGIFVFVTSNHPEKLDPALHRGGRLDRTVEFKGLDKEGKEKMVRRILDHDDDIQRVLKDLSIADLAPADLQNVLCKLAFKRRYGEWEEETA